MSIALVRAIVDSYDCVDVRPDVSFIWPRSVHVCWVAVVAWLVVRSRFGWRSLDGGTVSPETLISLWRAREVQIKESMFVARA